MMLAIENWLLNYNDINLFDGICIFIIIFCLVLCILIYNQNNLKKLSTTKRRGIFAGSFAFVLASLFLFVNPTEASTNIEEMATMDSNNLTESGGEKGISKLALNKIIIIGDSRMEYIEDNDDVEIPDNVKFIAKSGETIEWLKESAIPELKDILDENNNDYIYHVVLNMGVNDINYTDNTKLVAKNYYNLYHKLAQDYPNINFYMLSINPVDDDIINEEKKNNTRSNAKIESVNSTMIKYMKEDNESNLKYCDSYHKVEFTIPDGLHYNTETDQKIIDYITDKCVDYK